MTSANGSEYSNREPFTKIHSQAFKIHDLNDWKKGPKES
jgi:hypothetical protein